jgi:hypothetical protein
LEHSPYAPPKTTVKDKPDVIPPRPAQITLAIRILWVGMFAGLVGLFPWIRGEWWLNADGSTPEAAGLVFGIVLAVIFLGIGILFYVFIGRRHNWARWGLLVYLLIGWIIQAFDLPETIDKMPLAAAIDIVIVLSELWACYLLFLSPGAKWFKRQDG